ncbi:MAG: molybdenum cofactor guanylyltransferase [Polyangiaceae bacterium]|nr:molybdenum cofactor guanylyltransferase [Polyangiaceae bacterium]
MGRDKASIQWGDVPHETLFARTIEVISRVAQPVVAVASVEQELPEAAIPFELLRDETPYEGPLCAVARGLEALAGRADLAFVCGTDHPHLVPAVPLRLFELAREHDAAIFVGDTEQLLCAVYAVRTFSIAKRLVASGERSMRSFAAEIRVRLVTDEELLADPAVRIADPELRSFDDVDTPEDLERSSRAKEPKR